jgi:hypothetical protein
MVRRILLATILFITAIGLNAQENSVVRMPRVNPGNVQKNYNEFATGFWIAPELYGAYSCMFDGGNFGFAELDVTGGYRFNEYLRVGIGVGARYYLSNRDSFIKYKKDDWSFPIYANVRGNFIPTQYRSVVPYYSFSIGGSINSGFFFRPTVGLRIGQQRSAFLVSLSYVGQSIHRGNYKIGRQGYVSLISLGIGYEF